MFYGRKPAYNANIVVVQEIELVHSRLQSLDNLRLARFGTHLKKLCLRQNFLAHLDPEIFGVLTNLEELDLYDNRLKHVNDELDALTELR